MNRARGFTLIEVLVALAVVALGMSALLEMLSVSAGNVAALRDKTVAEWVAMNKIADTRLALNAPMTLGTTEGDIDDCAHGRWHWRQDINAVPAIPGLVSISVSVRRTGNAVPSQSSSAQRSPSGSAFGAPTSLGPRGTLGSTSAIGASGCVAASAPGDTLGGPSSFGAPPSLGAAPSIGPNRGLGEQSQSSNSLGIVGALGTALTGSSGASGTASSSTAGASGSPSNSSSDPRKTDSGGGPSWLVTLTGFHGNSLAASQNEPLIWTGKTFAPTTNNGTNNGLNGGATLGPTTNPGNTTPGNTTPGNSTPGNPPPGTTGGNPGLP